MLSITGIFASAFVIWKVRTMPSRAITCGGRRTICWPWNRTDPRSAR